MPKELPFDVGRLAQRKPLTGVDAAIRDLEQFPIGLLDESEREVFAAARATLGETQVIARRKGIELGFTVKKPSVWDRFKRVPQYPAANREGEIKYKSLPVQVLDEDITSVASDMQCRITKAKLDSSLTYAQHGESHFIPYSDGHSGADFASHYGLDNNFIVIGGHETLVQLKEHKGLPIFIVNVKENNDSTKPVGVYTFEPTDPKKEIYHVRFELPIGKFLLEVRSTGRKGLFEVKELRRKN